MFRSSASSTPITRFSCCSRTSAALDPSTYEPAASTVGPPRKPTEDESTCP